MAKPNEFPNGDIGSILTSVLWEMLRSSHSRLVSVEDGFDVEMVKSWCEVMVVSKDKRK